MKNKDFYFYKAKNEKYLARSVYKLIQIDEKFKILNKVKYALELGASPGSWSQLLSEKSIIVQAIDINNMKYKSHNINFIQADIINDDWLIKLTRNKFDIVLSDIAANATGIDDIIQNMSLLERIVSLSFLIRKNGYMIIKSFQCNELMEYIKILKRQFEQVKLFKPPASRKESSEIYILCIKYQVD